MKDKNFARKIKRHVEDEIATVENLLKKML